MSKALIVYYGPGSNSYTVRSVDKISTRLEGLGMEVEKLDLIDSPPHIFNRESMEAYIDRNYKSLDISAERAELLKVADDLTEMLFHTDLLVVAYPVYNFMVPASIKAWLDNIIQAKKTFKYGDYGPEGLLKLNHAVIVQSSGATRIGSSKDFASKYLEYVLHFMGIEEVMVTGLETTKLMIDLDQKEQEMINDIEEFVKPLL